MANTTNFNWETPDDTDLVKDGAAAIRTLGNSIDTSFVDLKGGTTGQILSKASNTDLDFTWIANDQGDITGVTAGTGLTGGGTTGAVTLTNDMATTITAAGDIVVGTGSGTYDNLPIGTTGQVLTADTTVSPYKVKWAAAAVGGANWSLLNAGGTSLTGAATVTVSGISGADKIMILVSGASSANAASYITVRFNSDTASNYYYYGSTTVASSTYSANVFDSDAATDSKIPIAIMSSNAASSIRGYLLITGCNASGVKVFNSAGGASASGGNSQQSYALGGYYDSSSAITSISIFSTTGNLDAGTVFVYTSA